MKFFTILSFVFILFFISCSQAQSNGVLGKNDRLNNKTKKVPANLKINSNCISKDPAYSGANAFQALEDIAIGMTGVTVSDAETNEFGDAAIKEMKKSNKYKFITNGAKVIALKKMLSELLYTRKSPSAIIYKIHLIEDELVNAFTVGGHIIITTGIIKKANSLSVMASIIGHEIGHNEKGHLKKTIKKLKVANGFVKGGGDIGIALQQIITPAFNQPNEVEADFYGTDLCYAAGYDPRKGIEFWEEMSKNENENVFESFLRSHPYSQSRANCLKQYIKTNYNL